MLIVEKEDLDEMVSLLKQVIQNAEGLLDGDSKAETIESSRRALQAFHTTAAMLGFDAAERVGNALEAHLTKELAPASALDRHSLTPFVSAINALLGDMQNAPLENSGLSMEAEGIIGILEGIPFSSVQSGEVRELTADELPSEYLGEMGAESPSDLGEGVTVGAGEAPSPLDFSRLRRIVESLGGGCTIITTDGGDSSFQLSFPASEASLDKIETLLSPFDPNTEFASELGRQDSRLGKVLNVIKEFMKALSTGEVKEAQGALLLLAEQQQQAGLYQQIGSMARQLHDSLRNFMDLMAPALVEMVEDKLPDSGSRLEHILHVTENAANTTLDHVEAMKLRNQEEQAKLVQLQLIVKGLKAVGDNAQRRLAESHDLLTDLQASVTQTSRDLITVLTAQDYQDLTGQVIMKIIQLLKDLEGNLVNLISTFGFRAGQKTPATAPHGLYGPAHEGKTDALHSQNDVDSLLAEFGF
jgi:chemotaxis protein CheZ